VLDGIEGLGIGHVEGAEDEGVEQTEDHCVGADGEGESEDRGDGKAWGLAEDAETYSDILPERTEKVATHRMVDLFFVFFASTELDASAAFGFGAGQAGAFEIVGAVLDVAEQFFVEVGAE
jgi:hypothetical protein